MLNLTAVVLGSSLPLFAKTIVVDPLASQPGQIPYAARGAWKSRPVDIVTEDNSVIVSAVQTVLIRLAEFTVPPRQKDRITIEGVTYVVSDPPRLDGQGGAHLTLKSITVPTRP